MAWARLLILGCLILSFTSCTCSRNESTDGAPQTTGTPVPDPNKAPDYSGITVEQVITQDIEPGKGAEAKQGSTVSGFYGMWVYAPALLPNKGKFIAGTPEDGNEMYTFTIGKGEVVKGWEQGVVGMKAGGKRSILVPISLAYGDKGTDKVPPGSILLIEFEATQVK
jgi:FKBP-type peptidyl-prolyl cis-trans isomerase FkpA